MPQSKELSEENKTYHEAWTQIFVCELKIITWLVILTINSSATMVVDIILKAISNDEMRNKKLPGLIYVRKPRVMGNSLEERIVSGLLGFLSLSPKIFNIHHRRRLYVVWALP